MELPRPREFAYYSCTKSEILPTNQPTKGLTRGGDLCEAQALAYIGLLTWNGEPMGKQVANGGL